MAKKRTEKEEMEDCVKGIINSINRWKFIRENGCNDPAWPDGTNMNLVRNHIIYYKKKISDICLKGGFQFPREYYMPTPPITDNNFMSNLKQPDRVNRLIQYGNILNTDKPKYEETQLSLF